MQNTDQELMDEANRLFNAGDYAQAEKRYSAAREEEPDNAQLQFLIGMCRERQSDPEGGLERMREAVRLGDDVALFHFHLGRLCLSQGKREEGREQLAQAIALNPNYVEARTLLGHDWLQSGDLDRAESELQSARRSKPDYAPALTTLALALMRKGDLEEAAKHAGEAARLLPDDPGTQIVLGQILRAQGHLDFAEQCWRNALEKNPDHPGLQGGLARTLLAAGRPREALPYFDQAVRAEGASFDLFVEFGRCLGQLGRFREVITLFDRFRESAPDHPVLVRLLAEAHHRAGDSATAAEILKKIDDPDAADLRILGQALHAAGRLDEALDVQDDLAETPIDDVSRPARLAAGRILLELDRPEDARHRLDPLLKGPTPMPAAVLAWAGYLENLGDAAQAGSVLATAIEGGTGLESEERARLKSELARLYDRMGEHDAAAEYLDDAGWISAGFLPGLENQSSRDAGDAWLEAGADAFAGFPDSAGDDRPAVIWALGWPGSARDLLVSALAAHPDIAGLDSAGWYQRRECLSLPASLEDIRERDDGLWRLDRRKYYRQSRVNEPGAILLEPAWFNVVDLPGLARTFPDARMLVLGADEADLHLHWLLSGFSDPMAMLQAYRREQKLFSHLSSSLPLKYRIVPRSHLLGDKLRESLEGVLEWLGLEWNSEVLARLEKARENYVWWPDGHWRKYAAYLGRD